MVTRKLVYISKASDKLSSCETSSLSFLTNIISANRAMILSPIGPDFDHPDAVKAPGEKSST